MIKEFLDVVDQKFQRVDQNSKDIITVDRDNKTQKEQIEALSRQVEQSNELVRSMAAKITQLEAELEDFNERYLKV